MPETQVRAAQYVRMSTEHRQYSTEKRGRLTIALGGHAQPRRSRPSNRDAHRVARRRTRQGPRASSIVTLFFAAHRSMSLRCASGPSFCSSVETRMTATAIVGNPVRFRVRIPDRYLLTAQQPSVVPPIALDHLRVSRSTSCRSASVPTDDRTAGGRRRSTLIPPRDDVCSVGECSA